LAGTRSMPPSTTNRSPEKLPIAGSHADDRTATDEQALQGHAVLLFSVAEDGNRLESDTPVPLPLPRGRHRSVHGLCW
jgi:hypothetical protein